MQQPLILTLQLDEACQSFYEALRRRYFPPERNLIPAHVSLFHQLPDEEYIHRTLEDAALATAAFVLSSPVPRSIGRGVAVFFRSEPLNVLHATLATAFQTELTAQDRQRFQPHVVVQNKVDPQIARQTLPQVLAMRLVEPQAVGLTLWRYLGGPWERLSNYPFGG